MKYASRLGFWLFMCVLVTLCFLYPDTAAAAWREASALGKTAAMIALCAAFILVGC